MNSTTATTTPTPESFFEILAELLPITRQHLYHQTKALLAYQQLKQKLNVASEWMQHERTAGADHE